MVKQHYFTPLAFGALPDQDVTRVGVTVHKTMDKYHLAVHLPQVPRYLWETQAVTVHA